MAAAEAAASHVPQKWKNVQAIHIKTQSSAALPIYTSLPEVSKIQVPEEKEPKKMPKIKADSTILKSKKTIKSAAPKRKANTRALAKEVKKQA